MTDPPACDEAMNLRTFEPASSADVPVFIDGEFLFLLAAVAPGGRPAAA
ncbi:hypothetical protein [Caballeronia sp. NK8]|nr:hypothetical protein [Caballeronia sp. NK8]